MPVSMKGSPQPRRDWSVAKQSDPFLPFGSSPHMVPATSLVFDPARGGWVQPDQHRAGMQRAAPPHWEQPPMPRNIAERIDIPIGERPEPLNYEWMHDGPWKLDLKREEELGLAPANWSVTSAMNDPRPNGKSIFDARFVGNAMGRAAGGYAMMSDGRGMDASAGQLKKAQNMDSNFFAADMADETAAGAASAEKNKYGNNTELASFDNPDARRAMALAQMSKLQQRQMDNDGDGQLTDAELRAHGFL